MRRLFGGAIRRSSGESSTSNSTLTSKTTATTITDEHDRTRPSLAIYVLNEGIFLIPPPVLGELGHLESSAQKPRRDHIINGELEIFLPPSLGARRCKRIRVGFFTTAILDYGTEGGSWTHELSRGWLNLPNNESSDDGVDLQPGLQRFTFSLSIRSTSPPSDWHQNAVLGYDLFADLEGFGDQPVALPEMTQLPVAVRHRLHLPASDLPIDGSSYDEYAKFVFDVSGHRIRLKHPERFRGQGESLGDDKLRGRYSTTRVVHFNHNPDDGAGMPVLRDRLAGFTEGLGLWEVTLNSASWTIAGYLQAKLTITSPSSKLTISGFCIDLVQTHTITPPFAQEGLQPQIRQATHSIIRHKSISSSGRTLVPLWRGTEAGGDDTGDVEISAAGRLPDDQTIRPSSFPGVIGPIEVSHRWVISVTFSVEGEGPEGKPLSQPGPAVTRLLKLQKAVIVPSCMIMPDRIHLPNYGRQPKSGDAEDPCPMCHTPIAEQMCTTCPSTRLFHPRHDHPASLVGNDSGVCPACSAPFKPPCLPKQSPCACGIPLDRLEAQARTAQRREEDSRSESTIAAMTKDDGTKSQDT